MPEKVEKVSQIIEISKQISIGIDDDRIITKVMCDLEKYDEITVDTGDGNYSKNGKEFTAESIQFAFHFHNDVNEIYLCLYQLSLFDPKKYPPKDTRKSRKAKNKLGAWHYFLFSDKNFDACLDFSHDNYRVIDIDYLIGSEYSDMKLSEFLETEQANYIRDGFFNPRETHFDWQQM